MQESYLELVPTIHFYLLTSVKVAKLEGFGPVAHAILDIATPINMMASLMDNPFTAAHCVTKSQIAT